MSGEYRACVLCEHRCNVDRTRGPAGLCRASDRPRVFAEMLEYGEEDGLVPAWAISLAGCNFTCPFCITGDESQDAGAGRATDPDSLARRARQAVGAGARAILVLGGEPTIHLPFLLDLAGRLRNVEVPLALKTNLACTLETLDRALDAFDVVVADFKFGNESCARRLGAVPGYVDILRRNLTRSATRRRTIVRHLLMPGHGECCWRPVADWVRRELPGAELSLRDTYVPTFRAEGTLARTTTERESREAAEIGS